MHPSAGGPCYTGAVFTAGPARGGHPPLTSRYLRRQSVVELLRNALHIYRHHFLVVFVASAPFEIPFDAFLDYATSGDSISVAWYIAGFLPLLCASSIGAGIQTVLLSDVLLGNAPGIRRAYSRVFGRRFWPFFATTLLANSAIMLGFFAAIVPGFILLAWFMFVPMVVILDNLTGKAALTRSRALGKGYYLRNLALLLVLVALDITADSLLRYVLSNGLLISAVTSVFTVFESIVMVLLYYDLRARKEAYDSVALAEDLMR